MNLKKLTQAVFDNLSPEYRWAAVDASGVAFAFNEKPRLVDIVWAGVTNSDYRKVGDAFGVVDWKNSLIERQVVPTADIDWSAAPEGATHWHDDFSAWYKIVDDSAFIYSDYDDVWDLSAYEISDIKLSQGFIARPESITDVARSIEAARVAEQKFKVKPCPHGCVSATIEQSERTYPHYFKDVSDVEAIDLYHVARLYDITDPALFHAFKKIACAGKRGAKDQAQDVQEAIDALKRWKELSV